MTVSPLAPPKLGGGWSDCGRCLVRVRRPSVLLELRCLPLPQSTPYVRRRIASILFVCVAILVTAIWISRVPEPSYEGVPLGSLLDGKGGGLQEIQQAVR